MALQDWWPKVVTARVPRVTEALGGGREGPLEQEEDPLWPWLVLLWWLEDW